MALQAMLPQDSVLPGGRVLPWYYRLCYHRVVYSQGVGFYHGTTCRLCYHRGVYCQGVGFYHGTTGYVITGECIVRG